MVCYNLLGSTTCHASIHTQREKGVCQQSARTASVGENLTLHPLLFSPFCRLERKRRRPTLSTHRLNL